MASHYEIFTQDGITHLFSTARSDSRDEKSWRKMVSPSPETLSRNLQSISGSPNARVPADW